MKKTNSHSDNKRLYLTKDKHTEAYFVRTDKEKFARFIKIGTNWFIYLYPYKYQVHFVTLTETLKFAEALYKKYWQERFVE